MSDINGNRTIKDLQQLQALPLSLKVSLTKARIRQWIQTYGEEKVTIAFSGGKDSTVLLELVRQEYPNIKAAFVDTGLEYPEIRQFVKRFDNVIFYWYWESSRKSMHFRHSKNIKRIFV